MAMLFVDRWLLAHYSTAAHNAAVNATTLGWVFVYGWIVLANITEVFVAQYNGAGLSKKLGEPVWQMIWLSIGSLAFFLPLSIWGTYWIYGDGPQNSLERDYFSLMMLFGPSFPLYSALCGFFIGQGKMKLITTIAIIANFVNAFLDQILIFGVEGWVPSLGVTGAAIATSGCTIFEAAALCFVFFNKTNRENYGSLEWKLKLKPLWQCVRIGLPNAVFVALEILGFAVYYAMMTQMGEQYITIVGICQSILILLYFFSEGINKGVSTVVGNLIGAGRSILVPKVIMAGLKLHLLFLALMLIGFAFGTELVVQQFLPHAEPHYIAKIQDSLFTCLFLIVIYLFFEGLRYLFSGVLTAAGDTLFLLITGSLSVWVMMVLPVYFIVVKGDAPVEVACGICMLYSVGASLLYLWRIVEGKWRKIVLSEELEAAKVEA